MKEDLAALREVCSLIRSSGEQWEARLPWLKRDLATGVGLWAASLASMALCTWLYVHGTLSAPTLVIANALAMSVLHELEHDIIHSLWARGYPRVQDLLFAGIMLGKLGSSPWQRKTIHLEHHKYSGQPTGDSEERLIGLGLPPGLKRMAVTMHPLGPTLVMRDVSRDIPGLDLRAQNKGAAPTTIVFIVGTKLGMLYGAYHLCGAPLPAWLPAHWWPAVCTFNLAMCIPYIVRQGGLQLMSNTSHYYMDVPPGGDGLLKQNQIISMSNIVAWPSQLLSFLFGATHVVHHLVPGQNFLTRTLVYFSVRPRIVALGVRQDDLGSVARSNAYSIPVPSLLHTASGLLWLAVCQTVGVLLFPLFDVWITYNLIKVYTQLYLRVRREGASMANAPLFKFDSEVVGQSTIAGTKTD